jgi:uncharacterized membrane protein YesL
MNDLGPWLSATVEHVKNHWQVHIVPLLLLYLGGTLIGLVATGLFMCGGFGVSIVAGITQSGLMSALAVTLLMILGTGLIVLLAIALTPIYFGHVRVVLRAMRGEPADPGDLYWGFRNIGRVAAFVLISGSISLVAAMACYFPAILVSVAFFFAVPAMVDRELGAVDALKASWELAKPRFFELLVLIFVFFAAMMVLSYVPLVGPFLGTIAYIGAMLVVYEDLVQRDHFSG